MLAFHLKEIGGGCPISICAIGNLPLLFFEDMFPFMPPPLTYSSDECLETCHFSLLKSRRGAMLCSCPFVLQRVWWSTAPHSCSESWNKTLNATGKGQERFLRESVWLWWIWFCKSLQMNIKNDKNYYCCYHSFIVICSCCCYDTS